MQEKASPLSKGKLIALSLGALLFVAMGVWLLALDEETILNFRRYRNPLLVQGIGAVTVLFFGFCALWSLKKVFDPTPGLLLTAEGFTDRSSSIAAGFVPWSAIRDIRATEIQKQKFVSVLVDNPKPYLESGNSLQRMAKRANQALCGTPINLASHGLKIDRDSLMALLQSYWRQSRAVG